MQLLLMNSTLLTNSGIFVIKKITLSEAKKLFLQYQGNYISAIGHASTASLISQLLNENIKPNRIRVRQKLYQKALCFKIYERIPESVHLTEEELKNLDYDFFSMERIGEYN
ncbi:DUF1874 domain-containing protein [Listeria booriae]|uniref:STIV orfB116 family protein n=1 Tax=Listeria booriae TaxID=1552123 RepID=UPI0028801943|nr:DUF1874 domain-containing protein [Listeria booriae]MDT0109334.1 DUF1874 domain-containing protein [Listeria booriae]